MIRILIILLLCLVAPLCLRLTDKFTIRSITSTRPPEAQWETGPPSAEILSLLSQPFHYLSKGAQCFVFLSEDGKWVLKFFRFDHLGAPLFANAQLERRREEKLNSHFTSYLLAYHELKEATGLLFLHLSKSKNLLPSLTLIDKIGCKHTVILDDMEFLLQKRVEPFFPTMEKWLHEGDLSSMKAAIESLVGYLRMRCDQGINDKDPDLATNMGFQGSQLIQLDVGRFYIHPSLKDKQIQRHELERVTEQFRKWLIINCPEMTRTLDAAITP